MIFAKKENRLDSYLLTYLFKTLSHGIYCDNVGLRCKCHLFCWKGALHKIERTEKIQNSVTSCHWPWVNICRHVHVDCKNVITGQCYLIASVFIWVWANFGSERSHIFFHYQKKRLIKLLARSLERSRFIWKIWYNSFEATLGTLFQNYILAIYEEAQGYNHQQNKNQKEYGRYDLGQPAYH